MWCAQSGSVSHCYSALRCYCCRFFCTIAGAADVVVGVVVVVVVVVEPEVEMHGHIECAARCTALL